MEMTVPVLWRSAVTRCRQAAGHVAIWGALALVLTAIGLAGCQSVTCYDHATCKDISQERGGQSDLGVEAAVDAKDNVVEGLPGL